MEMQILEQWGEPIIKYGSPGKSAALCLPWPLFIVLKPFYFLKEMFNMSKFLEENK